MSARDPFEDFDTTFVCRQFTLPPCTKLPDGTIKGDLGGVDITYKSHKEVGVEEDETVHYLMVTLWSGQFCFREFTILDNGRVLVPRQVSQYCGPIGNIEHILHLNSYVESIVSIGNVDDEDGEIPFRDWLIDKAYSGICVGDVLFTYMCSTFDDNGVETLTDLTELGKALEKLTTDYHAAIKVIDNTYK